MSVERIGRYLIEETLGRGAMGVVYLARDPLIDRRVALKTLRLDLDAEHAEEFRERFVREARAAGRLNHPGIVTIHDVGEDPESGLMYIAMEYVEGRDLKQLLAAGHRFRPSEAARIAADVANALDYAHSLGVVHRDIKPANIMLTGNGTAKITDFGIARLETSNLTVDGQFIGTPNFMSPEQVTGREVDGRSDLFSLGVVLFNLLTDQRPWGGGTMHEVTLRIVQEPCPIPSTVDGKIPPAFNPVVLKCLEKNPSGASRPAPSSPGCSPPWPGR
jgi:eukaryotic-like serine/threonine-protein kinase